MSKDSGKDSGNDLPPVNGWYELFSRGSRDWLRHSDKIREAVREHLPQIVAGSDIINHGTRTVRVPVRMLEHYRFRLLDNGESQGVGQGKAKPGDTLGQGTPQSGPGQKGAGGKERGGTELLLEFKIDDIIDWLWEDMKLPNLQPRVGPSEESDWKREGLYRRCAVASPPAPLFQGIDQTQSCGGFFISIVHRRGFALSATDSQAPAGDARRRVLPARRVGQHDGTRSAVGEDVFLLGGRRAAA